MKQVLKKWCRREGGATAIEYSLIAAIISLAITGSIFLFGEDMNTLLSNLAGWLDNDV